MDRPGELLSGISLASWCHQQMLGRLQLSAPQTQPAAASRKGIRKALPAQGSGLEDGPALLPV